MGYNGPPPPPPPKAPDLKGGALDDWRWGPLGQMTEEQMAQSNKVLLENHRRAVRTAQGLEPEPKQKPKAEVKVAAMNQTRKFSLEEEQDGD